MAKKLTKFEKLHRCLKKRHAHVKRDFEKKQLHAVKWLNSKNVQLPDLYNSTARLLTTGTLAGTLLLSGAVQAPIIKTPINHELALKDTLTDEEFHKKLAQDLNPYVPDSIGKIYGENQKKICDTLEKYLGFPVCFNLEGNELNYFYAWTGYEQHLYRFPGDNLAQHDAEQIAGIAPGLGAWGYFTSSKQAMTQEDYLKEKYYVAVQTLYLPEWRYDSQRLYNWYKYRKVVMINPENGTAVVAVVGDAGPANWTGKQFGGSPEVMKELGLQDGWRKGKVLLLFVNDKDNKIALGPTKALSMERLAQK